MSITSKVRQSVVLAADGQVQALVAGSAANITKANIMTIYAQASAADAEDASLTVVRTDMTGLNSGDQFRVGTTVISFMVTDSDGNSAMCDFVVTINDNQ